MHETSATLPLAHLLANAAWARQLARRLTRSPDDADDLLQDALLATLERPGQPVEAGRPWLTAVVTNLFRNKLRSDSRRARRERATLDEDTAPAAEATLAGLESHRLLATLVAELPEPYRQTIIWRYFEERSAADIAAMTGVPAGTVRWRLKTGIDRLRGQLDARAGGRDAWMALLAPFANDPRAAAPIRRPHPPGRTRPSARWATGPGGWLRAGGGPAGRPGAGGLARVLAGRPARAAHGRAGWRRPAAGAPGFRAAGPTCR